MADIEVTIRKEMRTMWISRKKFQILEKRIADLEKAVRSQQKAITSLNYPCEDVKRAFAEAFHQK